MRGLSLGLLLLLASPAHAGIFTLVKAASKVGSVATKAGKAGKLAKGGALLKGAGSLTAVVAAERVFVHAARGGTRVPLFVTKTDDGLRVVLSSGDELAHSKDSLRAFTAELDEMALVADDAGVDLYVDASAAADLADLPLGPKTRLYLANVDGPSLPLRAAADGGAEVAVSRNLWVRMGTDLADVLVKVASAPSIPTFSVSGGGCGTHPDEALASAADGAVVVVLDDLDPSDRDGWLDYAEQHHLDLVVLGIDAVCDDSQVTPAAASLISQARQTQTLGELWSLAHTQSPQVSLHDGHLRVSSAQGVFAVHATTDPSEELDPVALAFAAVGTVMFFVVVLVVALRKAEESKNPGSVRS